MKTTAWSKPNNARGAGLPTALGAQALPQCVQEAAHGMKDYFGLLRFNVICSVGFWTYSFFLTYSSLWNEYVYPMHVPSLYFGNR